MPICASAWSDCNRPLAIFSGGNAVGAVRERLADLRDAVWSMAGIELSFCPRLASCAAVLVICTSSLPPDCGGLPVVAARGVIPSGLRGTVGRPPMGIPSLAVVAPM